VSLNLAHPVDEAHRSNDSRLLQ